MQSLYILLPIALFFCFIGLGLFIWSMKNKQFEDLEREAQRILEIDTPPRDK